MEMLTQMNVLGAFLVGFLGGVHCLGMCGGIVAAVSSQPTQLSKPSSQLPVLFGYNLGRISSYVIAGALMGGLGQGIFTLVDLKETQDILGAIAAVFMIVLGFYLSGIWNGLQRIEKGGTYLWRKIEPLGRRFIPTKTFGQAFPLGLVWGWIPCGMVYTVLTWAVFVGSWQQGAMLMLAFGLGTLPNLLAMGIAANKLGRFRQNPWVRGVAGLLVGLFGVWMLVSALA
ncbi:MAG: Heavy-metal-associated domain (N-terminus) and membrane-bounded cytochrome biogenesis cycZ-like domain, possible membrane copper tolerance protein [uncultured Thiotrichaceae bacterium]|uniref:Heavy-metal-associated domain (N-terminus) and membrane-bounded cytochrome biogenesis cycZ-like domain, possible membrane copper tolerance protein n=1 Tax=uncultured Thiotrichaceae bacterium TaxID=298394 RepID=A0A6S6UH03_9GAMM|nr:MAG: Heavy-metal-associated domain (N-terminus) and membrane-bounded cytochrome biogenesis cycZ-like domain, possible membrane copper tolerance protein [uncultured Thiotrichaceae bacterium]